MALDDKDIFLAIFNHFPDKPTEFLMEQYAVARKMNQNIENNVVEEKPEEITVIENTPVVEVVEEPQQPPKKRYTKRMLKVKPQDAITEDYIYCCICGEKRQNLTAKHLATHEITVPDYKKLCGYPQDQKLMSLKRLEKSKEIIGRAQKARLEKMAANRDD